MTQQTHFHLIDRPSKANLQEAVTQLAATTNVGYILDWQKGSVGLRRGNVTLSPPLTKRQMGVLITGIFIGVRINQLAS